MPAGTILLAIALLPGTLDASLDRVPQRRSEWKALLARTPRTERKAVEYLLTWMPLDDLRALPTVKVRDAAHLAVEARARTTWGPRLPEAVFLDAVVPYANVTEPRDSMRAEWAKRYGPLVKGTKTSGEAALLVNARLFKDTKVTYNTKRLRTDQSPPETIAQGMATCTGLSIMLVDALRAVGVPSRVAGIPSWPGRGGNHTWVEVWDRGGWHFVGAAEPDEKGLDHAWFAEEAGRVPGTVKDETIYAVTYKPTGTTFPLVWNEAAQIPAENATPRYRLALEAAQPRLMVEVKKGGERVIAEVVASNASTGEQCLKGVSLGPQADMNLHLSAPAKDGETYVVTVRYQGETVTTQAKVKGDTVVRIDLDKAAGRDLAWALDARFAPNPVDRGIAIPMLAEATFSPATAQKAWDAYLAAPDPQMKAEFDANVVKTKDRTAPYKWRTVGEKPKEGWGLVIAMHGGGGTTKEVNDNQWEGMFRSYYKDHPEAGGYVYLALRAPNDEWDGFYDASISPLVERLIRGFVKYEGVDPNRVYAAGASHGGYGTFVIGPKIPYRFAALHPAAGAMTPDRTAGENLRNVHFTWAVGENDTAYDRIKLDREFQKSWDGWREAYGGFDGGLEEVKGHGHQIGDWEADKTAELRKYRREAHPKRVVWVQTDDVLHRFYWLEALQPTPKGRIDATVQGNTITLTTKGQSAIALWLSSDLVDLSKPVVVVKDGVRKEFKPQPSLATYCDGIESTGDRDLSAPVRIVL